MLLLPWSCGGSSSACLCGCPGRCCAPARCTLGAILPVGPWAPATGPPLFPFAAANAAMACGRTNGTSAPPDSSPDGSGNPPKEGGGSATFAAAGAAGWRCGWGRLLAGGRRCVLLAGTGLASLSLPEASESEYATSIGTRQSARECLKSWDTGAQISCSLCRGDVPRQWAATHSCCDTGTRTHRPW